MAAPKYIIEKAERLAKALDMVDRLSAELEEWAESKGADGAQFFYDCKLDSPYEFDLDNALATLDCIAEGEWE